MLIEQVRKITLKFQLAASIKRMPLLYIFKGKHKDTTREAYRKVHCDWVISHLIVCFFIKT